MQRHSGATLTGWGFAQISGPAADRWRLVLHNYAKLGL